MSAEIFGRDAELAEIRAFLAGVRRSAAALVLAGPPGSGKTTLLRAAAELASDQGYSVLVTTPARSEVRAGVRRFSRPAGRAAEHCHREAAAAAGARIAGCAACGRTSRSSAGSAGNRRRISRCDPGAGIRVAGSPGRRRCSVARPAERDGCRVQRSAGWHERRRGARLRAADRPAGRRATAGARAGQDHGQAGCR